MWPFTQKLKIALKSEEFKSKGILYRLIKVKDGYVIEQCSTDTLGNPKWDRFMVIGTDRPWFTCSDPDVIARLVDKLLENKNA